MFCVVVATFFSLSSAASFLKTGMVSEAEVLATLESELTGNVSGVRFKRLQKSLESTYRVLPKTNTGNLGHQIVRYVLHRHFVRAHGWFIRGLEPDTNEVEEWVPSYLQNLLEKAHGGSGISLHELTAFAAALEDLVHREARQRLELAYKIHEVPLHTVLEEQQVEDLITTFFVTFLKAGNFSADNAMIAEKKKRVFRRKYSGWTETEDWLRQKVLPFLYVDGEETSVDFGKMTQIVEDIAENYHEYNEKDCKNLKHTLRGMESQYPGRVPLSAFYKMALHTHWAFTEKVDYLRSLGALDESHPKRRQVISANYIMSRANCLEASHFYAICCRNECEDMMAHIESAIGVPHADASQVISIVSNIPSDTIQAPRELPESLVERLKHVADKNGGTVPLHGRLFAQWMHNAFPRECPFPHESGTTSPQTPDEWMKETGQQASQASKEEMAIIVAADTCMTLEGSPGCEEDDGQLFWSDSEELLVTQQSVRGRGSWRGRGEFLAIVVAGCLATVLVCDAVNSTGAEAKARAFSDFEALRKHRWSLWVALLFSMFTLGALVLDLFDVLYFLMAICGILAVLVIRRIAGRVLTPDVTEHTPKCIV